MPLVDKKEGSACRDGPCGSLKAGDSGVGDFMIRYNSVDRTFPRMHLN